jgi:DNA-nicking Smr family endonuclease
LATQYSSTLNLHGCTKDEATTTPETALVDLMDLAMKGEYPWVIPAVIVCGGGNQILSETVEAWIKDKKNVAIAPKRSL